MSILNRIIIDLSDLIPVIFNYFIECNNIFYVTNFKFICKKIYELTHNHFWFNEFKKTFIIIHQNNQISSNIKIFIFINQPKYILQTPEYYILQKGEYFSELCKSDSIIFKNLLLDEHIIIDIYNVLFTSCRFGNYNYVKYILDIYPNIDIHWNSDVFIKELIEHNRIDIIELFVATSFRQNKHYKFNTLGLNYRMILNYPIIYKKIIEIYGKHNIKIPTI
jgi:hypothetical protein